MDRSGRGLALVWRRQIQQLNRVSLEMASTIVDAYPSPQLLIQVCYARGRGPVCCGLGGLQVSMDSTGEGPGMPCKSTVRV